LHRSRNFIKTPTGKVLGVHFRIKPCGGDRDFNDLVVGYDFTAAAGHGILK
jgi:hypothetical protein